MTTPPNNLPSSVITPGGAPSDILGVSMFLTQFGQAVNSWVGGAANAVNYLLGSARTTKVASLGTPTLGLRAIVTDANATTFASTVAGGGTNTVPVYADGAHWKIG